ncbi:hypothetical protein E4U48_006503 [Claviceps purpurea]|nr:hypothetical protein E4U12_006844 [Claviceps purpurea]KAG6263831.1 hypothetical protein E4U48_006503 [Claviceps purpurea]
MASPTSAMAGAFPLVESSSMEYTTTEEKVVYWPGAPRLGELVADDLAVVRPGRRRNEKKGCRNRERNIQQTTFGSSRAGPGNGT